MFLSSADILISRFPKNCFHEYNKSEDRLDPDRAWRFVRPDLGPNC